ncbi:hypothetical protein ACTMTU_35510 [Streptomyces sp. OZ13]|uniref:hypothetical protein n=1 Tax=Streptomyces sp. OZ13 TaxID=3452210 RepID=UPI003F895C3D
MSSRTGWWDFTDTVPVVATHLEHLCAKGPHGPIWWRFGRSNWQPLTDALTNARTKAEYDARDEQRRTERERARVLEDRQRRDELNAAWPWSCPSCRHRCRCRHDGRGRLPASAGRLCPRCEHARRELEGERRTEDAAPANGIMARLRARATER